MKRPREGALFFSAWGSMASKHDKTANRIARKRGTDYNKGQGPDVETPSMAIEVETASTVADAGRQLSGYKKKVYVAGADAEATKEALDRYADSTIGVMDEKGNIVKPSTRSRK